MQRAFSGQPEPPAAIAPGCLVQGRSGLTGPLSCRNTASHRCIACRHGCRALPLHPSARAGFNAPPCLPACVCLPFGHPPFRFMGALRPPCALFPDFSRGTRLCIGAKKHPDHCPQRGGDPGAAHPWFRQSLRWHNPNQVGRSKPLLPLSPRRGSLLSGSV